MEALWPWALVAALGLYHGANPSLGWLLAATRGSWERSARAAVAAALPMAAGHTAAAALGVPAAAVAAAAAPAPAVWLGTAGALLLFGLARTAWMPPRRGGWGMWARRGQLARWAFATSTDRGTALALAAVTVLRPGPAALSVVGREALVIVVYGLCLSVALLATAAWAARWRRAPGLHRWWINLDVVWICGLLGGGLLMLYR
ncbi:MAG TPA: hypothetical protein VFD01_23505 [Candidatus Dormibacteraeota bacterium]|nr:hypothetical protein [Candidatus Dormibacteraeota bacterium]